MCVILNLTVNVGESRPNPVTVRIEPPAKDALNMDGASLFGLTDVTVCCRMTDASDGFEIRIAASPLPTMLTFTGSHLEFFIIVYQ